METAAHSDGAGGYCDTGWRHRLGNLTERIELGEEVLRGERQLERFLVNTAG